MGQKTRQNDFIAPEYAVSLSKTSERHLEIAWKDYPSATAVHPKPGTICLSPFRVNAARDHRAPLQQFRGR